MPFWRERLEGGRKEKEERGERNLKGKIRSEERERVFIFFFF